MLLPKPNRVSSIQSPLPTILFASVETKEIQNQIWRILTIFLRSMNLVYRLLVKPYGEITHLQANSSIRHCTYLIRVFILAFEYTTTKTLEIKKITIPMKTKNNH